METICVVFVFLQINTMILILFHICLVSHFGAPNGNYLYIPDSTRNLAKKI